MSTHSIEIVELTEIEPHPNADRMELTRVWGWQCCIGKGQFRPGDRAIYIPPDYVVPRRPEFEFLFRDPARTEERIRVKRLRGTLSQGLIIPVPDHLADRSVGTNVIEDLGVRRYEPPIPPVTGGHFISPPQGVYAPKFDLENYQRYSDRFRPGEVVVITEKIHGANARYVWAEGMQFCGSRTNWMAEDDRNIWWRALRATPAIGQWCEANPGMVLYGEVFGQVQDLKYGAGPSQLFFAAFAVLASNEWLSFPWAFESVTDRSLATGVFYHGMNAGLMWAPVLYIGALDPVHAAALAEGDSSWPGANHMREGVVITPLQERTDSEIGRVALKLVSNRYLES